jgi:hypothetical protein
VPQKENQIDRLWSWVGLPEGVIVESNGLGVMEVEPVNGQRTFLLDQSAPQEGMLVARLPDTGAILGVAPIVPLEFTVSTSILGYMRLLEKLDDSTLVLEESYFCKNFPEELHLEVYFWTSGAFFDDGSSRKNFHKDSFQNNHFTVHMMKFLNLERQNYHFQTSACHRTSVYLGDQELYRF